MIVNSFMKDEVLKKIENVQKTLDGALPSFVDNTQKCRSCSLRTVCYDESSIAALKARRDGENA